jgi:hypothetical protein
MAQPSEIPTYAQVIAQGVAKLRLPVWVGEGTAGRSLWVLVGLIAVDPTMLDNLGLELTRTKTEQGFRGRPFFKDNPVAYMLSRHLVEDEAALVALVLEQGWEALRDCGLFRRGFLDFIDGQLEIARQVIEKNELQTKKVISKSVLDRFLEVRRLLQAEEFSGTTEEERVASAERDVEKRIAGVAENQGRKRKTKVFRSRTLRVRHRRQRQAWDILYGLAREQKAKANRATARAKRILTDEEDEAPRQTSKRQEHIVSLFCYGRALRGQARDYPLAVGVPRDIGHAELCQVINQILKPTCDEDVLIATMVFGVCNYQQLKDAKVHATLELAIIRTKSSAVQRAPKVRLYRKTSTVFARPLPLRLGRDFIALKRCRKRFIAAWERVEGRLREISPHVTLAKFTRALVTHGESWLGLVWIVAEVGLRTTREKFPAQRSYVTVGPAILRKMEKFLRIYEPNFRFPDWWDYPPVGSKLCPETKHLVRLFRRWTRLLRTLRLRSTANVLKHWNQLAAGLHLLFVLFCGLRNHPMPGPPVELIEQTDWDLIEQKLHAVGFFIPRQLRQLMALAQPVFARLREELRSRGVTLEDDRLTAWAYCFLACDKANRWRCLEPDNRSVVKAWVGCRGLRVFGDLDRKALRHWSNTVLRENGFSELEVRLFHNHADSMLHGLRRHRLEPVVARNLLQKMADCLAESLLLKVP